MIAIGQNADDVKRLDWKISELEQRYGMPEGSVKMSVLLETASGIMNATDPIAMIDEMIAATRRAADDLKKQNA